MKIKESFYRTVHGPHHHWWAASVVAFGNFMNMYDLGAVNISLPQIMTSFQTSFTMTTWVLLAYLLTSTVLLLPAGRLADMIGRKKVYNLGSLIFVVGSALSGLSQNPAQLILFRVLQAAGISMIQTSSFAITSAVFPPKERGKGLGFSMTWVAIGATSGPSIGGLIAGSLGWRAIFFLNVPIGLIGAILGHLVLQEKLVSTPPEKVSQRFDAMGAWLSALAIGAFLVGMSFGQEGNWSAPETLISLGIAAAAMAAFLWLETRRTYALVDLGLFKNSTFAFNNTARFVFFLALSANILLTPFFLQVVQGHSPSRAGLIIAPQSIVLGFFSPVAGWLTNRISSRTLAAGGMGLIGLSFFFLSRLDPSSSTTDILLPLLLLGAGYGIFQTPNNTAVMDSIPKEKYGIASGILSLGRQAGQAIGVAMASTIVLATIFPAVGKVSLHSLKRDSTVLAQADAMNAFAAGITTAYLVGALLCAAGVIFCLMRAKTARDEGVHAGR
ncbi:MAG: MFS transporter [Chloroflexi bacterium]|nr:MFS transporter [Chloroflexota bacterium]